MAVQVDAGSIESATSAPARESSTRKRLGRCWPGVVCCALYVVLAMAMYGHFGSLGPGHMTGDLSPDDNPAGLVARVDRICSPSRPQRLFHPVAELSSGSELRGEYLHVGPRCALHADYQVVRPGRHLEHRAPSRRCPLSKFDVLRAPPLDDVVACRLRRRTALRLFRLYGVQRRQLPVSHFRAAAPRDLPSPPRDLGAPAVAAGKNRGPPRSGVCPPVLHLVRGPCLDGRHGRHRGRSLPPRESPPAGRATALRSGRLRLQPRCGRPAALPARGLHICRPPKRQGTAGLSEHREPVVSERPARLDRTELPMAQYERS